MNTCYRLGAVILASLVGQGALAEPRKVIVAAGDCRNSELLTGMAEFQKAMAQALKGEVYDPDVVLDIIRPRSTRSLDDIKHQVDSARTLFYGGQHDRALELLRQSLLELEKVSPELKPWPTTADALVLQAQLYRATNKKTEAIDTFKRVLRIDAQYGLDPDNFTPSTVQAFDALRREMARAKKVMLQVSANAPSEVFLDGRPIGKTPLRVEVVPGSYRLVLASQEQVSFARAIELKHDEALQVDMVFEGSVSTRAPLCLQAAGDKAQQDAAIKLASTVTSEEVVIFRLESARGDPAYYHAFLFKTSPVDRLRDASVKNEQLADLARFIATGKPIPQKDTVADARPKNETKNLSKTEPAKTEPGKADAIGAPPPPPPMVASQEPGMSSARLTSWTLLGAGAVSVGVGVGLYFSGDGTRSQLNTKLTADGRLYLSPDPRHDDAVTLMSQADQNRALSFALVGVGIAAVGSGLAMRWLFPASDVQVAVAPNAHGASFAVGGQF